MNTRHKTSKGILKQQFMDTCILKKENIQILKHTQPNRFLCLSFTLACLLCMHPLPLPVCLSACLSLCSNISQTSFLFIVIHVYLWVTYTVDRRFDSLCLCAREQWGKELVECLCVLLFMHEAALLGLSLFCGGWLRCGFDFYKYLKR